jgi:hypothetical protein
MSKVIELSGTEKGVISVTKLNDPYGDGVAEVASIGISLDGESPDFRTISNIKIKSLFLGL